MARYRKIDVRMWGDAKFRSLTPPQPCGQALWWYLLTNPNTTSVPGLYRAGESQIAEELGWPLEGFREAFREVSGQGLVEADWDARLVWIPGAMRYHVPESPNVVKSWATPWDEMPECELKAKAFQLLKAFTEGLGEAFREAFAKACGKAFGKPSGKPFGKPLANQEQEQEQEQKQDQDQHTQGAGARDLSGPRPDEGVLVPARSSERAQMAEVVAHYRGHHPKAFPRGLRAHMDEARKIKCRLSEGFTVEDLKRAIDGYHADPWHLGLNERNKPFLDLELIVRDAKHVQKGLEFHQRGPPPGLSQREKEGVWATESWLAKTGGGT